MDRSWRNKQDKEGEKERGEGGKKEEMRKKGVGGGGGGVGGYVKM